MAGLLDKINTFGQSLSPAARYGLLGFGGSLLGGGTLPQALRTGFGVHDTFDAYDKDKKTKLALGQFLENQPPAIQNLAKINPKVVSQAILSSRFGMTGGAREDSKIRNIINKMQNNQPLSADERIMYSMWYSEQNKPRPVTVVEDGIETLKYMPPNMGMFPKPEDYVEPKPIEKKKYDFSEGVKKDATFAKAQIDAQKVLYDLEKSGYRPADRVNKFFAEKIDSGLLNKFAFTPEDRRYINARQRFIEASVRKVSGATINESEYTNKAKTYFPSFGDDDQTILDKAKARNSEIQSFYGGSKPFFDLIYGDEQVNEILNLNWEDLYKKSSVEVPTEFINDLTQFPLWQQWVKEGAVDPAGKKYSDYTKDDFQKFYETTEGQKIAEILMGQ
tara:strand:+ start:4087 stop:5256 length:1170 start_codon:yes stop_codon:yes gene_type:complete